MADLVATTIAVAALSLPLWFGLGLIAPVRLDFEPRARRGFGRRAAPRALPSAGCAEAEEIPWHAEAEPVRELEQVAG